MLFLPWRDEEFDLLHGCSFYKEKYNLHRDKIESIHKNFEKFDDDLEEALASRVEYDFDDNISIEEQDMNGGTFGFFDPDRDEKLKRYDIGKEFPVSKKRERMQKKKMKQKLTALMCR